MEPEIQINSTNVDDYLFASKSPQPGTISQQPTLSNTLPRLRSAVHIPRPPEHSRSKNPKRKSPTSARSSESSSPVSRSLRRDHSTHRSCGPSRYPHQRLNPCTAPNNSPRQRRRDSLQTDHSIRNWTMASLQSSLKSRIGGPHRSAARNRDNTPTLSLTRPPTPDPLIEFSAILPLPFPSPSSLHPLDR
ncbi:hypothetical protein E1301_Tti018452 [Triplophysa tibetana]|uniref:Uncharacterized protein n=1 Tax=Triplophysa tibetana TaxID=1572043 RepID=A0A5A9NFR0_9TELE|nr:hypothetical protein E1301_Tti018452 [Triplophysa tibetana]